MLYLTKVLTFALREVGRERELNEENAVRAWRLYGRKAFEDNVP